MDLDSMLGLHFFMAPDFRPYQLITYMFMHANVEHIFFNMFSLWMFGRIIEQTWGEKKFIIFYLVCGIGAGFTQDPAGIFILPRDGQGALAKNCG